MNRYRVLTDDDVKRHLPMEVAVAKMDDAFVELANGTLEAPPRFTVSAPKGSLIFTAGAASGTEKVIGFRVYDTFPTSRTPDQDQITAVFDSETGRFKGLVIGRFLGATRTGAIGGVAIKHMSRPDARSLAVIGAGYQARTQVAAALAVRDIDVVLLYSRTVANTEKFKDYAREQFGIEAQIAQTAEEAVRAADVVICATNSPAPVLETDWLRPGTHVSTIGPQFVGAHEVPLDLVEVSKVVATDSLAQTGAFPRPFFVEESSVLVQLDQIVTGREPGRLSDNDVTLFCSVGLAGTEVVLANELLRRSE